MELAKIVRGADTDRFDLASQAAGLCAFSAGRSHNITDDHQMLALGLRMYDALYSWAVYVRDEKHAWQPV